MSQAWRGSDAANLTEAELDRLADYLADVLEPADAAEVALLVVDEPRWSVAHQALVTADNTVRTELADLATAELAMPADVAARLDDALRGFTRTPPDHGSAGQATVLSLDAARTRRRRLHRIAAVAAAVVAVAAGVGLGINALGRQFTTNTASAPALGTAADAGGNGSGANPTLPDGSSPATPTLMASQRNYTLDTLSQAPSTMTGPAGEPARGPGGLATSDSVTKENASSVPWSIRDKAPDGLTRLLEPRALAECLNAIRSVFPGVVTSVDYAQFAGQPALVVLVQQTGGRTAVAVGPDCGSTGADQKASVPVR